MANLCESSLQQLALKKKHLRSIVVLPVLPHFLKVACYVANYVMHACVCSHLNIFRWAVEFGNAKRNRHFGKF